MDKCTAPELIQEISANTTTSTTTKMPGEEVFIRLSHKTVRYYPFKYTLILKA